MPFKKKFSSETLEQLKAKITGSVVLPGEPGYDKQRTPWLEVVEQRLSAIASVTCPVPSGGALLMRPLLLHASSASRSPRHRRVVHLEYAAEALPGGLRWHQVGLGRSV